MKLLFVLTIIPMFLFSCKQKSLTNSFNQEYQKVLAEQEKIKEQIRLDQEKAKKQQEDVRTFGIALSAHYGAEAQVQKAGSANGDLYIVFKNSATGEYTAYNMAKWDSSRMSDFSQYAADADDIVSSMERREEYISAGRYEDIVESQYYSTTEWVTEYVTSIQYNQFDSQCSCYRDIPAGETRSYWKETSGWKDVVVGQRYIDESAYQSFYYGGGFRFENTASNPKDLDTFAANREQLTEDMVASRFKNEFSLSTDRAQELANLSMKYLKLENSRALTSSEKNQLAMKSLGVSMNQIETAMRSKAMGYENEYENLLQKAAQVNKTTPEMIGKFFNTIME